MNKDTKTFNALATDLLDGGNSFRFQAKGFSMRPLLQDGDFISIAPVSPERLRIGDIVFYHTKKGHPCVHRIIGFHEKNTRVLATIHGDACTGNAEYVPVQEISGRAILRERQGRIRRFDSFVLRLLGWLTAALSPVRIKGMHFTAGIRKKLYG